MQMSLSGKGGSVNCCLPGTRALLSKVGSCGGGRAFPASAGFWFLLIRNNLHAKVAPLGASPPGPLHHQLVSPYPCQFLNCLSPRCGFWITLTWIPSGNAVSRVRSGCIPSGWAQTFVYPVFRKWNSLFLFSTPNYAFHLIHWKTHFHSMPIFSFGLEAWVSQFSILHEEQASFRNFCLPLPVVNPNTFREMCDEKLSLASSFFWSFSAFASMNGDTWRARLYWPARAKTCIFITLKVKLSIKCPLTEQITLILWGSSGS